MSTDTVNFDEDADDDEYFSETLDGSELTGKEPKFVAIDSMAMANVTLSTLKVEDLIKTYIQARNQLATDRKGYNAREARVKEHLMIISMILRDRGDEAGVNSFATDSGTAFRHVKEKFRAANWDELVEYIKETGNFHILQKRVAANSVREIRDQDKALPPGVECLQEVEFSVRSPTARAKK
jgi:hypothetical protein